MKTRLLLLAALLASALLAPNTSGQTPTSTPKMRVHLIDVGQGQATLVEFPCAAVLLDTGGEENAKFSSDTALIKYLDAFFSSRADLENTLASIILTHPHVDHTHGVQAVLAKYRVQNAVTDGQETGSGLKGQKALHDKAASDKKVGFEEVWVKDIPKGRGLTSDVIDPVNCSDVDPKITALWGSVDTKPANWKAADFDNLNNHSVAVRIDFGKASLLVPGDLQDVAIADFMAHYQSNPSLLDVDVYQVGHHGSHNGTTEELVNALTPQMAVISMGPPTRQMNWTAWAYGHPRKTIVDLLRSRITTTRSTAQVKVATAVKSFTEITLDRAIYATGWDGTVVLQADTNGTWEVTPAKTSGAPASPGQPSSPGQPKPSDLVNINTADAAELGTLPMIGPAKAAAIVAERQANGPFQTIDDLRTRVPGIGPATIKAIRKFATTGS